MKSKLPCGCGHEEHCEDECQASELTVHEHEGAIVVSFHMESRAPEKALDSVLADQMRQLADWVTGHGGMIGHLKASLESPGSVKVYSITDRELMTHQQQAAERRVDVAAIVFLVEPAALEKQMLKFKLAIQALKTEL